MVLLDEHRGYRCFVLRALLLNCSLKPSPAPSSTQRMLGLVGAALERRDVHVTSQRVVDVRVEPGISRDEGGDDEWQHVEAAVLAADLLVLGTPIWLGHPSSIAQRVLERLNALNGETDELGRPLCSDRVALVAVVGNEDGAHHVGAELFQGLNDIGFTLGGNAMTYWVGEAMGDVDFGDLDEVPATVRSTTETMVRHAVHLAGVLRQAPLPAPEPEPEPQGVAP